MKTVKKKLTVALAATLAAALLAGCGTSLDKYPSTVAATYGSENIYLDEANFYLRYRQWAHEAMYWDYAAYFGYADLWSSPDNTGNRTMGDNIKEETMAMLWQTRVLRDHAADYSVELTEADQARVAEAVAALHENLGEEFFQYVNYDETRLTEWFSMNALAVKVWDAVKKSVEVSVSDEECQMFTIEYALIPNEEAAEDETEAAGETGTETPALSGEALADEVLSRLEAGESFDDFSEELDIYSSTESYLKVNPEETADTLYLAGVGMAAGEVRKVEDEDGWYIVSCVSELDEAATEDKKAEVTDEKQEAYFNEVYAGWAAASPEFKVKGSWDDVTFSGEKIYVDSYTGEPETEAETAAETEAETAAETEAETVAETAAETSEETSREAN